MADFEQTKSLLVQEGLARGKQARRAEDSLYPVSSNIGDFDEEDAVDFNFNRGHGFFEGVGAATMRSGMVIGAVELGAEAITKPSFTEDPTFDLVQSYLADDALQGRLDRYLADGTANNMLLDQIGRAGSLEEANYVLDLADANEERRKIAQNSFGAELLGTTVGVGVDILTILGVALTTRGVGLGGVSEVIPLIRGVQGSRAVALGRGAAYGAGEAFVEGKMQQLTDHTISNRDIAFAMTIGTLIGGTVGVAFPKAFNVDIAPTMSEIEMAEFIAKKIKLRNESVGAAAVDDPKLAPADLSPVTSGVPHKTAGSVLVRPLLESTSLGRWIGRGALRSPKRVITDMGVKGLAQARKLGRVANIRFYQAAQKLLHFTPAHADEIAGTAVRGQSGQQLLDGYIAANAAVGRQVERHFRAAINAMFAGEGWLRRAVVTGNSGRTIAGVQMAKRFFAGLDIPRFERMADKLRKMEAQRAVAKSKGGDVPELNRRLIVGDDIADELTDEQMDTLFDALQKTATDHEIFYQRIGRKEVEMGVIEADDLIPGYTPQIWNQDALKVNKEAFIAWMTRVFRQEVDEWWIDQNFREVLDEQGTVVHAGLREGETVEAFAKREPEAFNEIQRVWDEALGDAEADMVRKALDKADQTVADFEKGIAGSVLERLGKSVAKDTSRLEELNKLFSKLKRSKKKGSAVEAQTVNENIAKLERKIANKKSRISAITEAEAGLPSMRKALKGVVPVAKRKELARLYRLQNKGERRQIKQSSKKYVNEMANDIYDKIIEKEPFFGVVPDEFRVTSSRFKRRAIHLGKHEFDAEADMFLFRDQHQLRESMARGVGAQLAVREMFGIHGPAFDRKTLKDQFLSGFEEDFAMLKGNPKALKEAQNEMREADKMLEFILDDFLGTIAFQQDMMSKAAGVAMTATSALVLGKVVLSSMMDTAIQAFAGGRLMTGYSSFFRRNSHIFKSMQDEGFDYDEMSVFLEGLSTVQGRRFDNLADINRHDFDIPGSKFSTVRRVVDDIATLEGWASLMHAWNSHIRGAFGIDWANSIFKDVHKPFDSLSPSLQMFYRRSGLGPKEFDLLRANFAKGSKKFGNGRVVVPDIAKWDEGAYTLWKRAMKSAGDEAMLDPSIADRPFLKRNPLGRMVIQFQSFVFTAGDRYMAPLVQNVRLHPGDARNYWSLFIALGLAGMNDGIRAHMIGKGSEWRDNWTHPQGQYDNVTALMIRSPLAVGGSGWMYESIASIGGATINEVAEEHIGFRPMREVTKWQQNQGMLGAFGPAIGTANTLTQAFLKGAEGDYAEAAERLGRRMPVLNTIIPQFAMAAAFDKLEE
jgi:hypothetical protein